MGADDLDVPKRLPAERVEAMVQRLSHGPTQLTKKDLRELAREIVREDIAKERKQLRQSLLPDSQKECPDQKGGNDANEDDKIIERQSKKSSKHVSAEEKLDKKHKEKDRNDEKKEKKEKKEVQEQSYILCYFEDVFNKANEFIEANVSISNEANVSISNENNSMEPFNLEEYINQRFDNFLMFQKQSPLLKTLFQHQGEMQAAPTQRAKIERRGVKKGSKRGKYKKNKKTVNVNVHIVFDL